MSRGSPEVQYALPTLVPWQRSLLIALFCAYVAELVLYNVGAPIYEWLPWYAFGNGFAPWQPFTRFLVQGASQSGIFDVLIGLVVLYFFLPSIEEMSSRDTVLRAMAAGAVGATVVPLVVDAATTMPMHSAMGWTALVMVLPVVFGLARPDQDILLLVFPVKARWFLWGALVLALLQILVQQSLDTFETLGVWVGTVAWWHGLGPGARRRTLVNQRDAIQRELQRFEVIEGGRSDGPQGEQGDDTVH